MLQSFSGIPELGIEASEAQQMATAAKRVADLYDIKPTEKTLAWTNLAAAVAMVYGTRAFAYKARMSAEKAERAATPKTSPVNPLHVVQ